MALMANGKLGELGFHARIGGQLIAVTMLFALFLGHRQAFFSLGPQAGWAIELQTLLLFSAVAVMLLGQGKPAINDTRPRGPPRKRSSP